MKKKIFLILRIVVSLGIVAILFKFVSYHRLLALYRDSEKSYIVFAFIVFTLINILGALRWRFILYSLGIDIGVKEAAYTYFSSLFFNVIFPSLLGGDVFRGLALGYRRKKTFKVLSSVVMDRFSGAFALGIVALFAFILGISRIKEYNIIIPIGVFLIISIFTVMVFFNKYSSKYINKFAKGHIFKERIIRLYNELYFFRDNPKVFFISLIYSCIIQAAICVTFFILSKAFFLHTEIVYFFMLVPLIQFISVLPVSIAGIGTREAASVYLFSRIGMDKSAALSISLSFLFITILVGLIGGFIYVVVYHRWLERNT